MRLLRKLVNWFLNGDYGPTHLAGAIVIFDLHPWYLTILYWLVFCVVVATLRALVGDR